MTDQTAPAAAASRDATRYNRQLITPEGVALNIRLATAGDRLGAAMVDFAIVLGVSLVIYIVSVGLLALGSRIGLALASLVAFLFRWLYYPVFEFRWRGQTPGKRVAGLRVIDRHGDRLRTDAIVVRSLMREIEFWLPLTLLLAQQPWPRDALWPILLSSAWLLLLTSLPFFNRDVMRAGDILAGTWVVVEPKMHLLEDLADSRRPALTAQADRFAFTREQLDVYGIRELETLARVLRDTTPSAERLQTEVATRIARRIGWQVTPDQHTREFLVAYYAALRRYLEHRLLFGKRRLSKFDR